MYIVDFMAILLLVSSTKIPNFVNVNGDSVDMINKKIHDTKPQENSALIEKMYQVMEFIGGYRTLDELKLLGNFDREEPDVPKKLFSPSLKSELFKDGIYVMTLIKKEKGSPWTMASFFPKKNGEDVHLPQSVLIENLGLSFIEVEKTDFNSRTIYTYKYQWNKNPRVFVALDTLPRFFIPHNNYPEKFYFIEIYKK